MQNMLVIVVCVCVALVSIVYAICAILAVYLRNSMKGFSIYADKLTAADNDRNILLIRNVKCPEFHRETGYHYALTFDTRECETTHISATQFKTYLVGDTCNGSLIIPHSISNNGHVIFTFWDQNKNIHSSKMAVFQRTQLFYAQHQLISIHYEVLEDIVDNMRIEQPENVLFVHNMGRCGSNLLTKVIETIESSNQCIAINQTNILYQLTLNHTMIDRRILRVLIKICLKSFILGLMKHKPNKNKKLVFKEMSQCSWIMPLVCELFPSINHIFLYRQCVDQVDSFIGAFDMFAKRNCNGWIPVNTLLCWAEAMYLFRLSFAYFAFTTSIAVANITHYDLKHCRTRIRQFVYYCEFASLQWVSQMNLAYKCIKNGDLQFCICYKDLTANPEWIIAKLYKQLGWNLRLSGKELRERLSSAFAEDSHSKSMGLPSRWKNNDTKIRNHFLFLKSHHVDAIKHVIDEFKEYQDINHQFILPKTISLSISLRTEQHAI
eukprot:496336_1